MQGTRRRTRAIWVFPQGEQVFFRAGSRHLSIVLEGILFDIDIDAFQAVADGCRIEGRCPVILRSKAGTIKGGDRAARKIVVHLNRAIELVRLGADVARPDATGDEIAGGGVEEQGAVPTDVGAAGDGVVGELAGQIGGKVRAIKVQPGADPGIGECRHANSPTSRSG